MRSSRSSLLRLGALLFAAAVLAPEALAQRGGSRGGSSVGRSSGGGSRSFGGSSGGSRSVGGSRSFGGFSGSGRSSFRAPSSGFSSGRSSGWTGRSSGFGGSRSSSGFTSGSRSAPSRTIYRMPSQGRSSTSFSRGITPSRTGRSTLAPPGGLTRYDRGARASGGVSGTRSTGTSRGTVRTPYDTGRSATGSSAGTSRGPSSTARDPRGVDRGTTGRTGLERPSSRAGRTGSARPAEPAPGSRWGERSHGSSVYDPWDSHHHHGHFHSGFHFGFSFWWWSPWWWWWDSWWWPHVHYYPVSTAVYVPYYTPTYVDCAPSSRVVYVSSETPAAEESLVEKQVRLGDLFFRGGRYDAAARAYRRALDLAPDRASLHFVLADALFATGDVAGAAAEIRLGAEKDPSLVTAEVDKREFYGKAGDFDRQVADLEKRVAGDPTDADAVLVLGYNYLFSGRAKEARTLLDASGTATRPEGASALLRAEADRRLAVGAPK